MGFILNILTLNISRISENVGFSRRFAVENPYAASAELPSVPTILIPSSTNASAHPLKDKDGGRNPKFRNTLPTLYSGLQNPLSSVHPHGP